MTSTGPLQRRKRHQTNRENNQRKQNRQDKAHQFHPAMEEFHRIHAKCPSKEERKDIHLPLHYTQIHIRHTTTQEPSTK